jgi:hypothetical protein
LDKFGSKEPLLLGGYGLKSNTGRIALCLEARLVPEYQEKDLSTGRRRVYQTYEYEMFDEGDIYNIGTRDVLDIISSGGRIVITEV